MNINDLDKGFTDISIGFDNLNKRISHFEKSQVKSQVGYESLKENLLKLREDFKKLESRASSAGFKFDIQKIKDKLIETDEKIASILPADFKQTVKKAETFSSQSSLDNSLQNFAEAISRMDSEIKESSRLARLYSPLPERVERDLMQQLNQMTQLSAQVTDVLSKTNAATLEAAKKK